jgi:alpha-galactosidase
MVKIAVIGAGSLVFTTKLVTDLLQQEPTADADIRLMDIDTKRLKEVGDVVEAFVQRGGGRAMVRLTNDCADAVRGAGYVINTIAVGGRRAVDLDFDIPERYGIRQTIADTHGIGGISRSARTIPQVLAIARVIEEEAPDAWLLNETNPMATVVMSLARATNVRHVGLCHDAENTALELADYLCLDGPAKLAWTAGGINHMTWFLTLASAGRDLYPLLRQRAEDPTVRQRDAVRFELLDYFGYFVSESSVHSAEYYPWFLHPGGNAGSLGVRGREYLAVLDRNEERFAENRRSLLGGDAEAPVLPAQSVEYAPRVVAAFESNVPFTFMGNVANTGHLIENLPEGCCVEVPCTVRGATVVPGRVGPLPEACAALNRMAINVQLLTVEGILTGRRDLLHQAAYVDPLLSGQLGLGQIRELVDELLDAHEDLTHDLVAGTA